MRSLKIVAALIAALACSGAGEPVQPVAARASLGASALPTAADRPWPGGTIALDIDARDTLRGVYRVSQTFPIASGTQHVALLLPEWLPGHHAPRGPIAELVDLRFLADGKPVAWRRDPFDVHAFHVELPPGTDELVAQFIHTSPLQPSEGRVTMTPEMLNLQWEKMSLYPAGHHVGRIRVKPAVTLPSGWTAATSLAEQSRSGDRVSWAETDYETLVDSPIFAGAHFRKWELGHSVDLNVVADAPGYLALRQVNLAELSALVDEALITFGRPPFDRYDFLVALSDRLGGIGLEHLRSSENQLEPRNFTEWDDFDWDRNVLAHELVHSWNGKFRRPAGLATPDYRTPTQDDLLWVYEGQTQFWGWVLAARSGLQDKETVLGMIANRAGYLSQQPGRAWRSVADTTFDPIVAARKPKPYISLARGEDYYNEGALIWLEADQIIRQGTQGRRSLDDFARAFFSHPGGEQRLSTYGFSDVVAGLDSIYDYDWERFLRRRIEQAGQPAPLAGIERGGYQLVWRDRPNPYDKARMDHYSYLDLGFSLGLSVDRDGTVTASRWNGPAFKAGLVTNARIVAVDGIAFSPEWLSQAITRAQGDREPIDLLIRRGDRFSTLSVPYYEGLRWPWLERVSSEKPAPLDQLLSPRRDLPTRP